MILLVVSDNLPDLKTRGKNVTISEVALSQVCRKNGKAWSPATIWVSGLSKPFCVLQGVKKVK